MMDFEQEMWNVWGGLKIAQASKRQIASMPTENLDEGNKVAQRRAIESIDRQCREALKYIAELRKMVR